VTLRSPSDPASVEALHATIDLFFSGAVADETDAYKTLSAFREAVDNAAAHGNEGSPERFLTVTLTREADRVALEVKDEGPGFDFARRLGEAPSEGSAPRARRRIERGRAGGLGIKLMAECADEVRYSDGGSRVVLVKRLGAGRRE
jgi:anti-sigma regulatory factor (Ser/Thr protein kinase)